MSKLCGPILGLFVLFSAVATAAEPAKKSASAGPTVAGLKDADPTVAESAVKPVSLSIAVKPLVDDAGTPAEKPVSEKPVSKVKSDTNNQKDAAKKKENEKSKKLKPLKRRVIVVKATWCGACQSLNYEWPKLRKVRWRVGSENTDHFQIIDTDQDPGVVGRYGVTQLPTLLLIENGKVINRAGVLNAKDLAEFYYGRL